MALSLTTGIKDKVARRIASSTYANAGANIAALIDGEGASALVKLETEAQWFTLTTATGNAPDEWEQYFVSEIAARCGAWNTHPERAGNYTKLRDLDRLTAFETYTRSAMTYSPGSNSEAFVYTVQNNRNFCIGSCLRLPKDRFMPPVTSVDAALDEAMTEIWGRAKAGFNRRPVVMTITRTAFTGGTWTESTKTISGLSGVSTSLPTGTPFIVTSGTGATAGEYVVASSTATTIVLNTSLGSSANGSSDIAGFYYVIDFIGLEASESFDALASVRWRYTDTSGLEQMMCYVDADDFASLRARDTTATGRPQYFRTHLASGSTTAWRLSPPPDASYKLRGEVITQRPAAPGSASATTSFAKFAQEYNPAMRRLQLSRLLTNSGRHSEALTREVSREIDTLFPVYQDAGDGSAYASVKDVYNDFNDMSGGTMQIGGWQ